MLKTYLSFIVVKYSSSSVSLSKFKKLVNPVVSSLFSLRYISTEEVTISEKSKYVATSMFEKYSDIDACKN